MMTKMLARVALQLIQKVPKNLSPLKNWKGFMQHPAGDRLSKVAKNYGDGSLKNLLGDARQFVSNSHIEGKVMSNRSVPFNVLDDMSKPFLSASSKLKSGGIKANKISQKSWDKHWNAERKIEKYFDDLTMKKIKSSTGNIGIPRKEWDRLAKRVTKAKTPKRHSLQGMMDDIGIKPAKPGLSMKELKAGQRHWRNTLVNKLTRSLREEDYEKAGGLISIMRGANKKNFDIESLIAQTIRNYKGN
tara:strand:- start:107 stop:841 length:735 start_codon:yes stop_codon:yes gene_type:complete